MEQVESPLNTPRPFLNRADSQLSITLEGGDSSTSSSSGDDETVGSKQSRDAEQPADLPEATTLEQSATDSKITEPQLGLHNVVAEDPSQAQITEKNGTLSSIKPQLVSSSSGISVFLANSHRDPLSRLGNNRNKIGDGTSISDFLPQTSSFYSSVQTQLSKEVPSQVHHLARTLPGSKVYTFPIETQEGILHERCIFYLGQANDINVFSSYDDFSWNFHSIEAPIPVASKSSIACYHKNNLRFVIFKGEDGQIHQLSSTNGIHWNCKNLSATTSVFSTPVTDVHHISQRELQKGKPLPRPPSEQKVVVAASPQSPNVTGSDQIEPKRVAIAKEIVQTEQNYVESLNILQKVFFEPLLDSQLLSPSVAGKIFYGVDVLLQYHSKFCEKICSILKDFSENNVINFFALYSDYVNNYNAAMNLLKEQMENPDFAAFLVKCEKDPRCNLADIGDFLIQPIQRVPRYQLLLKDLLKVTPPTHLDYSSLLKALAKIEGVNKFINEKQREYESMTQVQNLQELTGKKLVKDGLVMFTPLKTKPEQLYCLLFTDGILFCEEKKRKNKESKLMMKYKFGLEEILLAAETDLHVFSCVNRLNKYLVNLVFPNQRNEWIKVLSNLMSRLPLFGLSRSSSEREMKTFETMRKKYLEFSQLLPVAVPGSNITVPQETIVKSDPDTQRKSVNFGKVAELKQIFGPSPSREEKEKRRKQYFSESSTL